MGGGAMKAKAKALSKAETHMPLVEVRIGGTGQSGFVQFEHAKSNNSR